MAKRGILEHPKTIELADALGIMECYAVGILECFWQWTARYHPDGDISGTKPGIMARAMRYTADPLLLWQSLASVGFIDTDGTKCTVHDWSEHADNSVHQLLKKRGERFADGNQPFTRNRARFTNGSQTVHEPVANHSRLPEPEPEPEPLTCIEISEGNRKLSTPAEPLSFPPSKHTPRTDEPEESVWRSGEWAEEIYAAHPNKRDKILGFQGLHNASATLTPVGEWKSSKTYRGAGKKLTSQDSRFRTLVEKRHRAWCESEGWRWHNGARAPTLAAWCDDEGYLYEPPADTQQAAGSSIDKLLSAALARGQQAGRV